MLHPPAPMLTVAVFINGSPLYVRSCVNRTDKHKAKCKKTMNAYEVDDGRLILHDTNDRALKLALELLKGIKEP